MLIYDPACVLIDDPACADGPDAFQFLASLNALAGVIGELELPFFYCQDGDVGDGTLL